MKKLRAEIAGMSPVERRGAGLSLLARAPSGILEEMAVRSRVTSRLGAATLFACLVAHLIIVRSIVGQPFNAQTAPPAQRSLIWPLHNDTIHRVGPAGDFMALYHAGMQAEVGRNPYDPERVWPGLWAATANRLPYYSPYRYLPILAETLGRLLAGFSARTAYVLWLLFTELVLAAFCLATFRAAPSADLRWGAPCLLLLSSPYFLELHMGQFSFVTSVLYVAALALCSPAATGYGRTLLASLSFTAAVLLKIVPIAGVPALVRRRAGAWTAASGIVALLATTVPVFVTHPDWWRAFADANFDSHPLIWHSGFFGFTYVLFQLVQMAHVTWTVESWTWTWHLLQVLLLGAAAALSLTSRERNPLVGGAALYLAQSLSYLDVWEHHMSGVLVVGIGVLWGMKGSSGRLSGLAVIVLWGALICLALPTPYPFFDRAADPNVWDPSPSWPPWAKLVVPLTKAGPELLLFVAALVWLIGAGLSWPWRGELSQRPQRDSAR